MDIITTTPLPQMQLRLLFELVVDVAGRADLGRGPLGPRGIVPITGGEIRGGPGHEALRGMVLPGGADRQQLRPDGVKELDAIYEVQLEDGAVLSLRNRVLIDDPGDRPRYARSHIHVTAPEGRWAFLNRRVILGTLQSARPARDAVIVRGWDVEDVPEPEEEPRR